MLTSFFICKAQMSIPPTDDCKHRHDQIQLSVVKARSPWEVRHCVSESNSTP